MNRTILLSLFSFFCLVIVFPLPLLGQETRKEAEIETADEAVRHITATTAKIAAGACGALQALERRLTHNRKLAAESKLNGPDAFGRARGLVHGAAKSVIEGKANLEALGVEIRLGILASVRGTLETLKVKAQYARDERRRGIEQEIRAVSADAEKIDRALQNAINLWNRLSEVKGGLIEFAEVAERLRQMPPPDKEGIADELDGFAARIKKLSLLFEPSKQR